MRTSYCKVKALTLRNSLKPARPSQGLVPTAAADERTWSTHMLMQSESEQRGANKGGK